MSREIANFPLSSNSRDLRKSRTETMTTSSSDLAAMAPVVLNHSRDTSSAHYDVSAVDPEFPLPSKAFSASLFLYTLYKIVDEILYLYIYCIYSNKCTIYLLSIYPGRNILLTINLIIKS